MPTTQEQLNAAVDQQFFQEHPDAPRRLDPHEPSHQQYVTQWNHIRDRTANAWADHYLKQFYPDSPAHLDPNNPAHHQYIEYWNDIHHQILTGQSGRWSWSSPPQHDAQGAQHTAQGAQHQAAQGAQHVAQGEHHGATHGATGAQHTAQGAQHAAPASAGAPAAASAPHASPAPQPAESSDWVSLDLRVNTKGVDGVNNLRGYEVWAQPIGTDNWYPTAQSTSGGDVDAIFTDVMVQPDAGIVLSYRATDSALLPELEAQIPCDRADWINGRNYLEARLSQQLNVVAVQATTPDEAIREACGVYPASGYIDEQQRNATDHPAGELREFEVWVGLPTVTA